MEDPPETLRAIYTSLLTYSSPDRSCSSICTGVGDRLLRSTDDGHSETNCYFPLEGSRATVRQGISGVVKS